MELMLTVQRRRTGACTDVVVTAAAGTRLDEVAEALCGCVLPTGENGALHVAGQPVAAATLLGAPPLVHGAVLQLDAGLAPVPAPAADHELRVVAGPDTGVVLPLPATAFLGRDADCELRLDDEDVSRRHALIQIGPDGRHLVSDLTSTNGTRVDGELVGAAPVVLPADGLLQVGGTSLRLRPRVAPLPSTPTGDGGLSCARPPRLRPHSPVTRVRLPEPPSASERASIPVLSALAPLVLGVVMWWITGTVTFLLFTLLSPVVLLGTVVSERRSGRRRTRRAMTRWTTERRAADAALAEAVRCDEQARWHAHPDADEIAATALGPGPRLWERRACDDDALVLRLGVASQPADVTVEGEASPGATTVHVPLTLPLANVGVLGVSGPGSRDLGRWLVVQAAVAHRPADLSIVLLGAAWDWARWLPHARPAHGQRCDVLLAVDRQLATARVAELQATVARRADDAGTPRSPVLLVLDGDLSRAIPGLDALLEQGPAYGVHAICVSPTGELPSACRAVAVLHDGLLDLHRPGALAVHGAAPDAMSRRAAEAVARSLAPLRDGGRAEVGDLPASVRWTELLDLPLTGEIQDAERVRERWATESSRTRAVLGAGSNAPITVDLRDDGPHALIAGTTGSGKSELLQTLLASLAVAAPPDELTFVLVDYKGGAAFGPCARLPHTVGLVTDLDGPLVERALASLTAELTRREQLLREAGAKDIDEHRGRVGRPGGPQQVLPRLVLVVDEFASLAEELPDFVTGLVGIAMRGRSLGVHLVLATQRPEGVVSTDIRANTNLRICLAVTSSAESRDVIDVPDAATLSGTTPGRGYVRTGPAPPMLLQTARIGGPRPRTRATGPVVAVMPSCELGDPPAGPALRTDDLDAPTDLDLLVRACADAAVRAGLPAARSPWLLPLPELLLDDALRETSPARAGRVPPLVYGLLDMPAEQRRAPLQLDLERGSHLLVVGTPRSGRTTVLRALAAQVAAHSADDVHLYALALGGGLGELTDLPHTGAVVGRAEPERVARLLDWLYGELLRRTAELSAGGYSSVTEQRAASPAGSRLPHLLLLLDRWEAFVPAYGELDGGRLVDTVHRLLQDGPSAGLHCVVTADRGALLSRLGSMVDERLVLRLADRGDYPSAGVPSALVPAAELPPGRGWLVDATPRLAQVSLLDADPAGAAQSAALRRRGAGAPAAAMQPPHRFAVLPERVRLDELEPGQDGNLVLGVGGDVLEAVHHRLDFGPGLLVVGPPGSGRSTTLCTVAAGLARLGVPTVAVALRRSPLRDVAGLAGCARSAADGELLEHLPPGTALLVDDAELVLDTALAPALDRAVAAAADTGGPVFAAGSTATLLTAFRGFTVDLGRAGRAVVLSPAAPGDGEVAGMRLPATSCRPGGAPPGRELLLGSGPPLPVQLVMPG